MLDNAEFFHQWCAGVEHQYGADGEITATRIVTNGRDRTERFLKYIPGVLEAVRSKRAELSSKVNRSEQEESTAKVLGWVATELDAERRGIEEELGAPTL
jgi:hypothetical protein